MNVSWTVSVRPSGAGMENIHFDIRIDMKSNSLEHCTQLEAFVSIVQGDPKKMYDSVLKLKSVPEVRFYFPACVLDSEFRA